MNAATYIGRLGFQQRVLPSYRAVFLDSLAKACQGGMSVFAGLPLPTEGIVPVKGLEIARYVQAKNWHFRDPSSSLFLCWQGGFIRWLEEWQPDALVVEANPRYLTTRFAIRWMHQRKRPVIGWGLGAPPIRGKLSWFRRWERLSLLRSFDAVIAYSRRGAEQYLRLGLPAGCIFVASNAVDPAPSSPPLQRESKFVGRPAVLFIGRIQARKRLDMLLYACAELSTDLQPHLIIIGDGPAREEFEALARKIYPEAEFVGAKHGSELDSYFSQADLFILPGTGGLAIQQAMAHALPVIVAHGDGTQDDLVRPENGWQISPDDQKALTDALRQALSDPAQLRRMGEASYRIVAKEINVETMVGVFISALNSIKRA
jgi:glycosyltransferase involved in cell wall biosynthesis